MDNVPPIYPFATAPAILRASQRDEFYISQIRSQTNFIFKTIFGHVAYQKSIQSLKFFSDFIYYAFTTLLGTQTLGEEYSDIMAVDSHQRALKFPRKILFVAMMVFTPYLVKKTFAELKKRSDGNEVQHNIVKVIEQIILGPLFSIHLATFYFTGAYYDVVKRVAGIRYMLVRKLRKGEDAVGYEILGIMILLQQLLGILAGTAKASQSPDYDDSDVAPVQQSSSATPTSLKCTLCLGNRKNSTAAVCGHVFCWKCIADWIRTKPECPLCRTEVTANTLLPLLNY